MTLVSKIWEWLSKFGEPPDEACPVCGSGEHNARTLTSSGYGYFGATYIVCPETGETLRSDSQ